MTNQEIRDALFNLSEDLRCRLIALRPDAQVSDFSVDEQAEMESTFGPDWPSILGIAL